MNVAEQLAELLGEDSVATDAADLDAHAGDCRPEALIARRSGPGLPPPACVVRPADTGAVSILLAWADRERVPIVPFGAGSGVCGAISPTGAVVVDTARLNLIAEPDGTSRLVTAGAGTTGPALRAHLHERGLTLGHEPQSVDISTLGGWIATRACGQLSARYGGIEALVSGLEAVLPGGRVVRTKAAPRRAAGPDIASLLIGSEGTLGIVTEATVRVFPLVTERVDRCVCFDHMAEGVAACRAVAQSDLGPTLVRLFDAEDASIFLRAFPAEDQGPLLLLSFDGFAAEERSQRALELSGGRRGNDELVGHWWEHRNDAVDDYRVLLAGEGFLGPHGLVDTIEMSGTWSVLRDLYHSVKDALSPHALLVSCHLSHVYPDGAALYFTMAAMCSDDDEARTTNARWWEAAMSACLSAGGSISHHHGIGRVRAPWMEAELGGWWTVLRAVKSAIDPNAIMNPGAMGL